MDLTRTFSGLKDKNIAKSIKAISDIVSFKLKVRKKLVTQKTLEDAMIADINDVL